MCVFVRVRVCLHHAALRNRPTVAGIHGSETEGCYSLALSGGYEDDIDMGDCFTYTGSGTSTWDATVAIVCLTFRCCRLAPADGGCVECLAAYVYKQLGV